MSVKFNIELKTLRQISPIGIRKGLLLLEKTSGDIDKAKLLFEQEMVNVLIDKIKITEQQAHELLMKVNFDINLALKKHEEEHYTLTERILRLQKNRKERALEIIAGEVEERNKLKRNFWLDFNELRKQTSEEACLLMIMEWLNYEGWESFASAVYFHLDDVIFQIEQYLFLSNLVNVLKTAREINEAQYESQKRILESEGAVSSTKEFLEQWQLFDEQRETLINTLYEFVVKNSSKFPK